VDAVNEGADVPLMLAFLTGHWEWVVIGGVILLLFFGSRIPSVMRSLGKGVTQFKKGLKDGKQEEGEEARALTDAEKEEAADDSSKRA
jgi:sec-independent protein translocase protein TatA